MGEFEARMSEGEMMKGERHNASTCLGLVLMGEVATIAGDETWESCFCWLFPACDEYLNPI